MMAAQLVTFLVITLSRFPCRVRLVSTIVVTRSRRRLGPLGGAQDMVVDVLEVGDHRRRRDVRVPAQQRVDHLPHGQHHSAELDEAGPQREGPALHVLVVGSFVEQQVFEPFNLVVSVSTASKWPSTT